MKQYAKYKPTGINWIGEIPSHWEETRLKYIGYLYAGLTGKSGVDFKKEGNPSNKPFIPFFLNYLLLNTPYRRRMMIEANGFTRINLKMEKVNDFFISLPPKSEQTAIANFLDEKTEQITQLIANKQKLIELLKEERTAIINEAVSGEGKNWEKNKLKYVISKVGSGVTPTGGANVYLQEGIPLLRSQNIYSDGLVLDKERLKNGAFFSKVYFDNLLAEIREIRASERNFYQKITDIYATAMDYKADDEVTQTFFAAVQNKLHFAIHGHTAAELVVSRANSKKEHMGLTSWKNSPSGKIIKTDVSIAKNYLNEKELKQLDRFVTMYLDYAETQAERNIPMTMNDWAGKLNAFLQFNEKDILKSAGKVTQAIANNSNRPACHH